MGLEERRKFKKLQDETVPKIKAAIKEACGVEIAVELDEASFMAGDGASYSLDNFERGGMDPTVEAIREVAQDEMGKKAIQDSLKKIVFKELPTKKQNDHSVSMKGGVLTVENYWGGSTYNTSRDIKSVIEGQI